ncbi:MAG: class I SAM-dependent methyltransferase [Fimbriiglobus sp.]|nr:class I SAM-dependent methyltransferase [Fimbriiglobus sp.]
MSRLLAEREFHDTQAAGRSATFRADPARLRFADADFLDHETWVRPAFERLGPLAGRHALDYGCGHGMAAVVMARAGATVSGFDLSPGYVAEAEERAAANSVRVRLTPADAEDLPYADASFDAVWGNAILHHLDLDRAGAELHRVLKPGGVAVFCEPWGGNPLLGFARRRLPYPGKHRTVDEKPLAAADLTPLRRHFPNLSVEAFQLLGMVRRVCRLRPVTNVADVLDRAMLRVLPGLRNWCRYVVLTVRKE